MKVEPIQHLKTHPKQRPLTFGDFVAGVYHSYGKRRAKGFVRLVLALDLIEFRGEERFEIF